MNILSLCFNKYKNYLSILLGAIVLSIGVTLFLVPNQIVAGGTPGIAILVNHFTSYQLGIIMFVINIPMILISMKYVSKGFAFRTILTVCITSFTVDFLHEYLHLNGFLINPILASMFGGMLAGFGLGFIIEGKASAGGPSVVAKLIAQNTRFKEEKILITLDAIIVISAGIVFESIESTLFSLVTVYSCSKGIDVILSGRSIYKMVHISTLNAEVIGKHIVEKLGIQGTILMGKELDLQDDKKILMLVIHHSKIVELKSIIKKYDEESFIVISDASEIMGRGH